MNSLENLVRVGQLKPEPPADDESSVSLCSPLNIEAYRWLLMEHGPQPIGAPVFSLNLEKAVNHGEHGGHNEKSRTCMKLPNHPPGDVQKKLETLVFRCVRRARRGLN